MLIMHVKIVFPMRWDWLLMLLLIGIFGFCAQVLLTLGLQREAVGRGTMAVYVQV
jgi:drug/metabolite transporter (DMT)-like permease